MPKSNVAIDTGADSLSRDQFFKGMRRAAEARGQVDDDADLQDNDDDANDDDASPLDDVAALEADIERGPGDGKAGERDGDDAEPTTLLAVAERLGISAEDVYKLEIDIDRDGETETLTLGQIKDLAAKASDLDTREVLLTERAAKQENEVLRAKREIQELIASLPAGTVTKEMLEKSRSRAKAYRDAEAERLLEAIPEWENDEAQQEDRAKIKAHLSQYGLEPSFLDAVIDHRLIKFMRDSTRRYEVVTKALKNMREVKPNGATPPSSRRGGMRPARKLEKPNRPLSAAELRREFASLG